MILRDREVTGHSAIGPTNKDSSVPRCSRPFLAVANAVIESPNPYLSSPLLSCAVVVVDSCIAHASPAPKLGSYHRLLLRHRCFPLNNAIVDVAVVSPSPYSQ